MARSAQRDPQIWGMLENKFTQIKSIQDDAEAKLREAIATTAKLEDDQRIFIEALNKDMIDNAKRRDMIVTAGRIVGISVAIGNALLFISRTMSIGG
jgi:hypothetical protein